MALYKDAVMSAMEQLIAEIEDGQLIELVRWKYPHFRIMDWSSTQWHISYKYNARPEYRRLVWKEKRL